MPPNCNRPSPWQRARAQWAYNWAWVSLAAGMLFERIVQAPPSRWAFAAILAFVLMLPAGVGYVAPEALKVTERPCIPPSDVTADAWHDPQRSLHFGRLPEEMPDSWMKAPCPQARAVREIRGRCFVAIKGETPPCEVGYESPKSAECVVALNKGQKVPNSIGRTK